MSEILFLAHRIPFPPNKGDKIRAFNLLKWLAARHVVHLGAFVDDAEDWQHLPDLEKLCAEICLRPLHPRLARLRSLTGFITGEPLTLPYYRDRSMQQWVNRLLARRSPAAVFVFSSCMAQYASSAKGIRRIIDFVDLDSDKWRQFASTRAWPQSWIYRREAHRLAASERKTASEFDCSVFVSAAEAELFKRDSSTSAARVTVIRNGVDAEFFAPHQRGPNPYPPGARVLVFTGAMDYWPNVDAVVWFAKDVLPRIRRRISDASFYIVGARPSRSVLKLADEPGVQVVGKVLDVRPYIGHAKVAVAPLRLARGVQNKVLEAMAMAKPVAMTQAARQGLEADALVDRLVADDPQEFAERSIEFITGAAETGLGEQCRKFVRQHYDWDRNLDVLDVLLGTRPAVRHAAVAHA